MKKSEIVIAVMSNRSATPLPERKIIDGLSSALKYRSRLIDDWDEMVDADLAAGIVKHISAVKGDLSIFAVIEDIDILLKRISTGTG